MVEVDGTGGGVDDDDGGCGDAATLFGFLVTLVALAGFVVGWCRWGFLVGGDDDDKVGVKADSMRCCSSSNDLNGFLLKLADNR